MGVVMAFRMVDEAQLQRLKTNESEFFEETIAPGQEIDVDKSWDGIHYLFTGKPSGPSLNPFKAISNLFSKKKQGVAPLPMATVLSKIFNGGTALEGTEQGITFILFPPEVSEINTALESVSDEELLSRFDADAMSAADVYLSDFWRRDQAEALDYLKQNLKSLRTFFRSAAAKNTMVLRIVC